MSLAYQSKEPPFLLSQVQTAIMLPSEFMATTHSSASLKSSFIIFLMQPVSMWLQTDPLNVILFLGHCSAFEISSCFEYLAQVAFLGLPLVFCHTLIEYP